MCRTWMRRSIISVLAMVSPKHLSSRSSCRCRAGRIKAAVVLLISRAALQTLKASINFEDDSLTIFDDRLQVPLPVNAAGQHVLSLMKPGVHMTAADVEVMSAAPEALIVPDRSPKVDHLPEVFAGDASDETSASSTSTSEPSYQIWVKRTGVVKELPKFPKMVLGCLLFDDV